MPWIKNTVGCPCCESPSSSSSSFSPPSSFSSPSSSSSSSSSSQSSSPSSSQPSSSPPSSSPPSSSPPSSSPPSSSSSSSTISQCGCDGIPETLTATLSAATCAPINGLVIALTWMAAFNRWQGSATANVCGGARSVSLTLECVPGTCAAVIPPQCRAFAIRGIGGFDIFGGGIGDGCDTGIGAGSAPCADAGCSCGPLNLVFTNAFQVTAALGPCAGFISVTVTE